MAPFLLEIGTEEIPSSYLRPAAGQLREKLTAFLDESGVEHGDARVFYTPRRLAVLFEDVALKQKDSVVEVSGPQVSRAFDPDGKPTGAATGFASAQGVQVNDLSIKKTPRGEVVVARKKKKGVRTSSLLAEFIPQLISTIYFPKSMSWEPTGFRFARPIRWMVALLGKQVVRFEVAGVESGDRTCGHRFLSPVFVRIDDPARYETILEAKHVIPDPDKRRKTILTMLKRSCSRIGTPIDDPELLEEVNGLVEEPNPVRGCFDKKYLELPQDVVVTAMREHQRYFSIVDASGKLVPHFVAFANGKTRDDSIVKRGYEDILLSKLEDASFHWQEDTSRKLEEMAKGLKQVVWQENLGTLHDKCERLAELAKHLALRVDGADSRAAERAAMLCKADLVSNMVRDGKEFAKLQGIMGREYAVASGEDERVAVAIGEHYLPRYPGDSLPRTKEGSIVSVADRLDSIVGSFINAKIPTGSEDPYGLRRLANGMIAVIVEGGHHVSLSALAGVDMGLFQSQFKTCAFNRDDLACLLFDFFKTRMEVFLGEKGISYDIADAVISVRLDDLTDATERARALSRARQSEEFKRLATGQKRVANILKGAAEDIEVDESLFAEIAEKSLYAAAKSMEDELAGAISAHHYDRALEMLLSLKDPIDAFFDQVLVMAEDKRLRKNRLALLGYVAERFSSLADFSKITTE